jgi:catechol 2,3-dioxygenase-like lactoylglutathione lyase family enzyme
MKRIWTIIAVTNVAASFRWYQSLFGQTATSPHHDYFGQIVDGDGTVLLCLHAWGEHEHPSLSSPDAARPGNGLLLFFRVDDFDAALTRARGLVDQFEEEPHVSSNTRTPEFSLRDPDGYYVTISALTADDAVRTTEFTKQKAESRNGHRESARVPPERPFLLSALCFLI